MNAAITAVWSVVSKALSPVSDGLLEAWAASKDLSPNIDALKTELLYVQGVLSNTRGREIDNLALNKLLQQLRQLAYWAEDVLDELDYFRIQDGLYGTCEAANEHAKGCVCNLFFNAHHTVKAISKLLKCSGCSCAAANPHDPKELRSDKDTRQQVRCCAWPCARGSAGGNTSLVPNIDQADGEASGCIRKLASGVLNTVRTVGKFCPCSSFPHVHDDVSGESIPYGLNMRKAPQIKHAKEAPKLEFSRVDISKRMKHIVDQLQPLCAKVTTILNLELLGLSHTAAPSIAKRPPTITSDIIEPTLYGRDPIKGTIVASIIHVKYSDKDLTIMPIVGPGGIGKTTLVQHIYNSQEVKKHFDVKVWICVPQDFMVDKLIEEIKNAIPTVEGETRNGRAEELIEQRLNSKRFLFIFDDIWRCESEDWKRLSVPLKKGQAKGSVILVTTRFPIVAETVKTIDSPIKLEGLKGEEFRNFFQACIFGEGQACIFGEGQSQKDQHGLLQTGDKIADSLKGSPLAAKTVGKLLRNHLDVYHWTRVLEIREWEMQNGERDIMPALKLSYDYLPYHLQQCFSCCGLFPEDYKFNSEELINFWIGLNILPFIDQNKTVEDVGLDSLNDLVNHGFLEKDETDGRPYYIIHDMLHDLALKVASHEYLTLHHSNVRSTVIRPSIRHLSIIIDISDDSNEMTGENFKSELRKLKARLKVENLQTLILFGGEDESFLSIFGDLFKEANALRVLCLPTLSYPLESMLQNFSALLHLRYLRLGTSLCYMHLPTTLSRLYHLRILDLKAWQGCPDLPRDLSNLANLCHFFAHRNMLDSGIYNVGKLKLLQELKVFAVNKESVGFKLNQLEHLTKLREVGICNLDKIHTKEEALEAKLIHKEYLQKLSLGWAYAPSNTDPGPNVEEVVLENLQPPKNLQELSITGHKGRSCPTWLGEKLVVHDLQSIYLSYVSWDVFPSFGKMWDLRELTIEHIATIKEFTLDQSFCKLAKLTLISLENFKNWIARDSHLLPCLQVLIIKDCRKLLELPCSSHIVNPLKQDRNIDWFPKLQELIIENCPKVLLVPPIPWTESLCSVKISGVGSELIYKLVYSKSSSGVALDIMAKDGMHSLDQLLLFSQLTELQELDIAGCPPLELKYFLMLTSLKKLCANCSNIGVVTSGGQNGGEWQHSIECIEIWNSCFGVKELTQFLSHLPKLSKLAVYFCENITPLAVEVDSQKTTTPGSLSTSLDIEIDDAEAKDEQQQIEDMEDDGLLILPPHLSNSLQALVIKRCGAVVHSLSALQAITTLWLEDCSFHHPFPPTLLDLQLFSVKGAQTMEHLSNLTSLTRLQISGCGEDLRCEGLLPLLTQGQLSTLDVRKSPNFFGGWDPNPMRGSQSKLKNLGTDDMEGFLGAPALCSLLSSSLTHLKFTTNDETARFTKKQEEAFQRLTSLQQLEFWFLVKLEHLPAGLNKLTNLKRLWIKQCRALCSLPKDGLPSSLQELDVNWCDNEELTQQCRRLMGTIPKIKL